MPKTMPGHRIEVTRRLTEVRYRLDLRMWTEIPEEIGKGLHELFWTHNDSGTLPESKIFALENQWGWSRWVSFWVSASGRVRTVSLGIGECTPVRYWTSDFGWYKPKLFSLLPSTRVFCDLVRGFSGRRLWLNSSPKFCLQKISRPKKGSSYFGAPKFSPNHRVGDSWDVSMKANAWLMFCFVP